MWSLSDGVDFKMEKESKIKRKEKNSQEEEESQVGEKSRWNLKFEIIYLKVH